MDHYLNIVLPESSSIVFQIHIENRESECLVWLNLMDGKSFCRNFLDLVWFSATVVRREVGVPLRVVQMGVD